MNQQDKARGDWFDPLKQPKEKSGANGAPGPQAPEILTADQLLAMDVPSERMLFEGYPLPAAGATLKVGAARSGKTLLAIQEAVAIASGKALFDYYRVCDPGPVMIVELDDPGGAASVSNILKRCAIPRGLDFHFVDKLPFSFGPQLLDWLQEQIVKLSLRLVILDSYTALRGPRSSNCDIVKVEQAELTALDGLGKTSTPSALQVIHHGSKGAAGLDWTQNAAGTYAMAAATEAQIHMSRFGDLSSAAPERLVRIRGRHSADVQMVLRLRRDSLDFEHVIEGDAAAFYPLTQEMKFHMGSEPFGVNALCAAIGVARATAYRHIARLRQAGILFKRSNGEYSFDM